MEMSPELKELVQPGKKVRLFFSPDNINNELRHIRAIVDDEYIVCRVWSRRKRRWIYKIHWFYIYQLYLDDRYLQAA